MSKLRISIVEFLNTAPLVWGFTDGPLAGKYDFSFTVPSQCAEALRSGDADVAIIPAIEYQRIDNVVALPGMAVAAKGEVRSLLVVAKKPIELRQAHRARHQFAQLAGAGADSGCGTLEHPAGICGCRAGCFRNAEKRRRGAGDRRPGAAHLAENGSARRESRRAASDCCKGDPEDMPVPGFETIFVYDVAHQWREMTGKPCVLAIWAGRRDAITPEVVADFQASKRTAWSVCAKLPKRPRSSWICRRARSNATSPKTFISISRRNIWQGCGSITKRRRLRD